MGETSSAPSLRIGLEHPLLAGKSGRGVRVAVIDSGISEGHPHVGEVAGGLAMVPRIDDGAEDNGRAPEADFSDRLGHGTAVAAAIREKASDAELFAIKIFDRVLAATASDLEAAIEAAVGQGCRLLNLSLGTDNLEHEERLGLAVARAGARGAVIVSPRQHRGRTGPHWIRRNG